MRYLSTLPLGWRHIWIVSVASLGQLVGTAVATLAGIVIPLIQISIHHDLPSWLQGLLAAADLIGIAIGSVVIGKLSDRFGYLPFFRLCPVAMLLFSLMGLIFPSVGMLLVSLFMIGFAIGGEYSLDSDYISELMPLKYRSLMVGVAKAASALGNVIAAGICWWLLSGWTSAGSWPKLLWILVGIAVVMIVMRIHFAGSPTWYLAHGHLDKAREAVRFFLGNDVELSPETIAASGKSVKDPSVSLFGLIRSNFKKVVFSGVPWACEGLGVYGIGVFIPILVMALGLEHFYPGMLPVHHVADSVRVTFLISCLMIPGFIIGLWFMSRKGNVVRQLWGGFFLCALSLVGLVAAFELKWPSWISILFFMAFEVFLQAGPHLVTYVLPPKIYPVEVRSLGSGLAASIGKVGAVLAVFFIPIILKSGGASAVLWVSVAVMLVGGLIALLLGPKILPDGGK